MQCGYKVYTKSNPQISDIIITNKYQLPKYARLQKFSLSLFSAPFSLGCFPRFIKTDVQTERL